MPLCRFCVADIFTVTEAANAGTATNATANPITAKSLIVRT
jgi:hypothetical protein